MSNSNNKSTSMKVSGKRKKFRMRKRARRTVASLLLVSALVISLIPTQQKTQAYVDPDESVLAIDKVIEKYALHSEADTEVKQGTKNIAYAFPCTGEAPEIIGDHKYFKIDMTGMTKKDETPVPVYNISTADTDCTLNLFYGYDLPFNGAINLNNGVCFNNDKGKAEDTVTFTDDVNSLKYVQENIYETVSFSDGENTQTATINYYKVSVYEVPPVPNNGSGDSMSENDNEGADNDIPDSETENDIDKDNFEGDEGDDQTYDQTDDQTDDENTDYEGDDDNAEKDGDGAGGDKLVDQYYACANNANVTFISDKAFEGNGHVTSINVSQDDLKKIGNYAFKGCSSLTSIEFGSKLSSIGREAFSGCNALSDVKFSQSGSSLKIIGDGAFAGCSFSEAILPDINNLDIGAGAFYACTHLGSIDSMFANFNSSGHKVYVGPYAFAITNLTDVNMYADMISENNNSEDKADKKGYDFQGLFAGCTNLTRVALPANYGTDTYTGNDKSHKLGKYMFHKCPNLTRVKFSGRNAEPYDDFQFITESTLSYAKKYHKDHPDSMDYQNVTVASTFVIEGPNPEATEAAAHENARRYSNTYNYDYIDDDHPGVLELLLGGYIFNFSGSKVNGSFVGTVNEIIPTEDAEEELSLPADIGVYHITTIGDGIKSTYVTDGKAKQWENKLKILTIPESVIIVGNRAFSAASGLEKLYVNTNGVTIGDSAFENDAALIYVRFKQVTESDSPGETKIGAKCFKGCKSLLEVDFRDDLYSSDKIIDVNVTSIGNEAFKTGRNEMFVDRDLLEAGLNRLGSDVRSFEKGNGFWLIMKGKMDISYEPYCFALGLNKTGPTAGTTSIEGDSLSIDADIPSIDGAAVISNKVSDKINSYITYASGNPENISARYNDDPAKGATGVALMTYPSAETMVGRDDSGNAVKISDIIKTRNSGKVPSQTEWDILHKLISITVPQGIELLDEAVNTGIGYEVYTGKDYLRSISGNTVYDGNYVHDINLNLSKLPEEEGIFKNDIYLEKINFEQNVKDLGTLPFLFDYDEPNYNWRKGVPDCSLHEVNFSLNEGKEKDATKDDPYYWCSNGIVYSYDGTDYTLEEVLYGRGNEKNLPDIGDNWISQDNDPDISKITKINESAFKNCPYLHYVDLTSAHGLETIPANCFNNDPNLSQIWLPESVYRVEKEAFRDLAPGYHVYFYGKEVFITPGAITDDQLPTIHCHLRSSAEEYALANLSKNPVYFDGEQCEVFFYDSDMTTILRPQGQTEDSQWVDYGKSPKFPKDPEKKGYKFDKWKVFPPTCKSTEEKIVENPTIFVATYIEDSTSSSSSSSSSSTDTTSTSTSSSSSSSSSTQKSSSNSSSDKSSSKSSSSSKSGGSSSSSTGSLINSSTVPIIISGYASAPAAATTPAVGSTGTVDITPSTGNSGGKTSVISTTTGITDTGKMSANVNGSSDNYVVKISETQEADDAAMAALSGEFGSLNDIRYFPFDISLYDSTGTNKISPVPAGVTVSVTLPLPDDLAIYGGNNKIASTEKGQLEKMSPKFTVINSVPCMTFTASHFSPYVIYVDTANLAATGTLDQTPQTGDPIHPKWFLVTGLVAAALFMFLKRDKEEAFAAV